MLAALLALPAAADTQFSIRRMTRNDVPFGKGQCDIRLQVDGEAEVSVRGNEVQIRTISGRDPRDDGSECNEPLPGRALGGFNFEVIDSRGDIALQGEPSPRNGYRAVVRIRDSKGGEGRYHFRLSWSMDGGGGGDRGPGGVPGAGGGGLRGDRGERDGGPGGPGAGWNDSIDFRGPGRGTVMQGRRRGRVMEAVVRIDRNGRVDATMETDSGRLSFSGRVVRQEGNTLFADVNSGGIRGNMAITTGRRNEVLRINMDGQSRGENFRLDWSR